MTRGALVVIAVLAALASVEAVISVMFPIGPRNDIARDLMRHLDEQDRKAADIHTSSYHSRSSSSSHHRSGSGLPSAVAHSVADQIDRSEQESVPVPYTKKFYLTFGPYYVENPLSITDKKFMQQKNEMDVSSMPMG